MLEAIDHGNANIKQTAPRIISSKLFITGAGEPGQDVMLVVSGWAGVCRV